jgi:prepilin-type N-terminal cleavage/methylation domain-containing protein
MKRGFSLTELLVVMGILAILIGILLPTIAGVRKAGEKTKAVNDVECVRVGVLSTWQQFRQPPKFLGADDVSALSRYLQAPEPAIYDGHDGLGWRKLDKGGNPVGKYFPPTMEASYRTGTNPTATDPRLQTAYTLELRGTPIIMCRVREYRDAGGAKHRDLDSGLGYVAGPDNAQGLPAGSVGWVNWTDIAADETKIPENAFAALVHPGPNGVFYPIVGEPNDNIVEWISQH